MNEKRIAIGVAAWFLGIVVPVLHHVGLNAALASQPTNNAIRRMMDVWDFLPRVDWIYLALMTIVGGILVASGLLDRPRAS